MPIALGQQATLTAEKRASLIAERDAIRKDALAVGNAGQLEDAGRKMEQVYEIECSLFGDVHAKLLDTLSLQARLAHLTKKWGREIEFRQRASVMGQELYGKDDYRFQDLERELIESRSNASRTAAERQRITQAAKLHSSVVALYTQGRFEEASRLAEQVRILREETLGKQHPDYAGSLNNLAALYDSMGDYPRAEELYLESKSIREQTLGKQHPEYARSLNNLAILYESMGDYPRAETLLLKAKAITEQTLGEQHSSYATGLNNLAALYRLMGDYARAEPLLLKAKSIRGQTLGKEHPDYARSLNSLAALYKSMGDFQQAEPLYRESKSIREQTLGKQHPDYARSLNNLAALYRSMGDYARAEPLLLKAKVIREQTLGKQHPDYAGSLNSLAILYKQMGDFHRAEPLYLESKAIREQTLGKQHPDYAGSLSNLAILYRSMGDYPRAEPLMLEAKAITEQTLSKQHPDYARSLNNLAILYKLIGDYPKAEPLLLEAKAIRQQTLGKQHPDYARSLNNLAALYFSMGDYPQAKPLYLESKAIREQTLGKQHPDYAESLNSLAALYKSMGDFPRAEPLFRQAVETTVSHLEQTSVIQSEQQQLLMTGSVRYQLDNYLGCCLEGGLGQRNAVAQIVDWKGSILLRQRGLRLAASDPAIADQFRQLQSVTSQISAATRSTPDPKQVDAWKRRLKTLSSRKRDLESELMRRSAPFKEVKQRASFADFQASIPEGGVVVDYLEYNGKQGRSLLASVIHRDGDPVMLDLGSAERAGKSIDTWRASFGMTTEAKQAGQELRKQLWEPVLAKIGDPELIIVSTDGVLGRIPMAALPGAKPETYLLEDHRVAFIPVPQLLPTLMKNEAGKRLSRELLLMGDVDYDAQADASRESGDAKPNRRKRPFDRSGLSESIRGGACWNDLSETGNEVRFIAELYNNLFDPDANAVVDLRKAAASETAFRKYAPQSMLLHLATHGFFAAPEVKSALSVDQGAERGEMQEMLAGQQREVIRGHNPGQLSGIVFAGANNPPPIDPLAETTPDDGIMTADEIAFLPLNGVRLAVLSACETGLGEVAGGEGLLGIQRGFQVAGTRSTIASLWKVNDAATRRLMQEFYINYLDKEMSVLDALREAQLWALNNPAEMPRGVRLGRNEATEVKRLPPQYWAAFTLSGDWR